MTEAPRRAVDPPFSPILLAGLAVAPVPLRLLRPVCDAAFAMVRKRHPDLLDRLSDYPDAVIGIDPLDLPFVLVLRPEPEGASLAVERDFASVDTTAIVRGPLSMLIALGEGRLDGDAAFFSRQLVIEGDTEVVLALRNAVDAAAIDLVEDVSAALGPLSGPLKRALGIGGVLFDHLASDMDLLRRAIAGPAQKTAEAQNARISQLEAEIATLRRSLRQREPRS